MEFIGQYLRSVRLKKKLKLKKISEELMINERLLADIENDYFPEYIGTVFLIGHVRSYAKFLNLDHNDVVESFKIQSFYNKAKIQEEISKPIKGIKLFSIPKTLAFASIFILTISFYFLFVKPNDLQPEYAMTPDVPENIQYNLEETEMNIALLNRINQQKKISNSKIENNIDLVVDESDKFITSSSVIASLPKEQDTKMFLQIINLKFLNPTWIQLRDKNDKIIISRLMNPGDEYTYNLSDNLSLTAGNAGNIIISLDGKVKGKAGKAGEVVDSLIIDSNFTN